MRAQTNSASRAITEYFNSPAWNAPQESDLLVAIMRELMASGQPATNKAIVARVIEQLELEGDEKRLQSYRNLLAQLIETRPHGES
ncbi:biofilm development regulator YmgB/AriR family protein [[Erwinia] mediterraneensis]|uniref:biofilm development regulator YmgB/AriR family protein n=1 Tax=[Erwinia] mediterraneensis TaxID=2161819 RepID=UPI0010309DF9|nr:biofilm development regulator YmgB/AriR family protein [[Erwinia] mediterraneensis]